MQTIQKQLIILICLFLFSNTLKLSPNPNITALKSNTSVVYTGIAGLYNPPPKLSDFNQDVARTVYFIERRADFHEDLLNHAPKGSPDALQDTARNLKHGGMKGDQFEDLKYSTLPKGSYDYKEDKYQTVHWALWKKQNLEDASVVRVILASNPPPGSRPAKKATPIHKHNSTRTVPS